MRVTTIGPLDPAVRDQFAEYRDAKVIRTTTKHLQRFKAVDDGP